MFDFSSFHSEDRGKAWRTLGPEPLLYLRLGLISVTMGSEEAQILALIIVAEPRVVVSVLLKLSKSLSSREIPHYGL